MIIGRGLRVNAFVAASPDTVLGANDCLQPHQLNTLARERILRHFMAEGVDIPCADGVIIGPDVHLENNITILPGTILRGQTTVRSGCMLGPNTLLTDCSVGGGRRAQHRAGHGLCDRRQRSAWALSNDRVP